MTGEMLHLCVPSRVRPQAIISREAFTTLHFPRNDFMIPLDYFDVQRQTQTGLDVLQEATVDIIGI